MGKHKRRFSERQLRERERLEAELAEIEPMCELARRLTSAEGFVDYYLEMRDLYHTQQEAYERLEDFHVAITGRRRYSEFDSFRVVCNRYFSI